MRVVQARGLTRPASDRSHLLAQSRVRGEYAVIVGPYGRHGHRRLFQAAGRGSCRPGEQVAYSVLDAHSVLGLFMQRASGRAFGELMQELLFAPLGMREFHLRLSCVSGSRPQTPKGTAAFSFSEFRIIRGAVPCRCPSPTQASSPSSQPRRSPANGRTSLRRGRRPLLRGALRGCDRHRDAQLSRYPRQPQRAAAATSEARQHARYSKLSVSAFSARVLKEACWRRRQLHSQRLKDQPNTTSVRASMLSRGTAVGGDSGFLKPVCGV